jgi:hypothetical protein
MNFLGTTDLTNLASSYARGYGATSGVLLHFFDRESCELYEFHLGCSLIFEPRKGTEYTEVLGLWVHFAA